MNKFHTYAGHFDIEMSMIEDTIDLVLITSNIGEKYRWRYDTLTRNAMFYGDIKLDNLKITAFCLMLRESGYCLSHNLLEILFYTSIRCKKIFLIYVSNIRLKVRRHRTQKYFSSNLRNIRECYVTQVNIYTNKHLEKAIQCNILPS